MTASIFDTLRHTRRLKEAGVAPEQAEAMAAALAGEFVPNLVTKSDLGSVQVRTYHPLPGIGDMQVSSHPIVTAAWSPPCFVPFS